MIESTEPHCFYVCRMWTQADDAMPSCNYREMKYIWLVVFHLLLPSTICQCGNSMEVKMMPALTFGFMNWQWQSHSSHGRIVLVSSLWRQNSQSKHFGTIDDDCVVQVSPCSTSLHHVFVHSHILPIHNQTVWHVPSGVSQHDWPIQSPYLHKWIWTGRQVACPPELFWLDMVCVFSSIFCEHP